MRTNHTTSNDKYETIAIKIAWAEAAKTGGQQYKRTRARLGRQARLKYCCVKTIQTEFISPRFNYKRPTRTAI